MIAMATEGAISHRYAGVERDEGNEKTAVALLSKPELNAQSGTLTMGH